MATMECTAGAGEEPCRCPQCAYRSITDMITRGAVALSFAAVALLMSYVLYDFDHTTSFTLLLAGIFCGFYFAVNQMDVRSLMGRD